MMAAEATSEKPVDVSVTDASLSQTTATTEFSAQDVEASSPPTVNGGSPDEPERTKAVNDIVEDLAHSAEVSVSGGSDTEASTSKAKDPNHVRTSSTVKKPQSFKSVSVNKTFLGAKNAANAISRSENSSPSLAPATPVSAVGSSASKLKLVAKSGSSLGGASKTLTTNGKAPSAPDGSTVWNKNKAAPAPEPKKYSDEELKKYGIHMADRLRPEDDRGQSNWADEDEDEEWAPEAITWTDGTRVTLENQPTPSTAPAVPVPTVAAVPVPVPAAIPPIAPKDKPKSPAPGVTSDSARASPSVKPSLIASSKNLVLKGAPEKPTLVAKAPAPLTPAKSPWATLPPVDKASPVMMELPNPHQPPPPMRGYPPRDSPYIQNANITAKEIAADDFSRGPWRDGQPGGNRELFNSQSGRYEPVQDRRGSRHDPNYRQHPALLQRSAQQQDFQGPAEPSAAFQTSRSSGYDAAPYGRRRTSSNVSGGSGIMHRLGKPHDMPPAEHIIPAPSQPSPARSQHAQPWQPRPSPGQVDATLHNVNASPVDLPTDVPATTAPSEDDIELQKRLMRERRELAIKRRLEEEAKEEAARKERIALKLAAMGPAPERKSTKKEDTKEVAFKRDGPPAGILSKEELAAAEAERGVPPGTAHPGEEEAATAQSDAKSGNYSEILPSDGSHAEPSRSGPPTGPQSNPSWPESGQKPVDRVASWSSGSQNGPRNLWAAPGNDRSLGNGTFDADLGQQLADSEPAQPASMTSRPTPIGPPRNTQQSQQRLAPIGPPSGTRPGSQPIHPGSAPRRNPWATADIAADDRALRAEKQKHAEEYRKNLEAQGVNINEAQHSVRDTWRGVDINPDGKRITGQGVTAQHNERMDRHAGSSWNAPAPNLGPEHVRHEPRQFGQPAYQQDYRQQTVLPEGPYGRAANLGPAAHGPSGAAQSRAGSRFFPHSGSRDIRQEESIMPPRPDSPTPPPPTMDGHPAYDGDAERPHVSLPPTRPVVKLPPAAQRPPPPVKQAPTPIAPPKPATFAAAAAAAAIVSPRPPGSTLSGRNVHYGGGIQSAGEIKTQENWQQRINSLMRTPHAKPMSVDSSSKYAFDGHTNTSATVSLPALSPSGSSASDASDVTTKEMAEECFDEQEMGSLPLVNLPNEAPSALWSNRAAEPNWLPLNMKYRVDATASESVRFPYEQVNHKSVYRIMIQGMDEAKTIIAPFSSRNRSDSRRQGRGGRGTRGGSRGGRDSMGDHQSSSATLDRPERSERSERSDRPSSRGGRGNFRARSEHWTKSSSTLGQPTQS
ncbi:hypothetical protein G7054_g10861 [Neopestalotiopsis clavispora]|nr:hypothetical protein G7054_g10861 [Neopestalotiopsis clavispora]